MRVNASNDPRAGRPARRRLTRILLGAVATAGLVLPVAVPAAAVDTNSRGTHDGYYYSFWTATPGTASMDLGPGGSYTLTWNDSDALFAGKGWNPGSADRVVNYSADHQSDGASHLALYGWLEDPLAEYYVVETWEGWRPPGGTPLGVLASDGGVYDVYRTMYVPLPESGDKAFYRYWSVRQTKRTSGTITLANHLNGWADLGFAIGTPTDEQIMVIDAYRSSGTATVTFGAGQAPAG